MQKLQKHRLILLLGVFVALVFFYLGVNTWMETQERKTAPPPVVRTKPPVQIKPEAQQVKPQTPKPQQAQKQPQKPQKVKEPKPVRKEKEPKVAQKPRKPVQKQPAAAKKAPPQKRIAKKTPPQQAQRKAPAKLREFVAQIGAFKNRANAERRLKLAQRKGFSAFIVEEGGLYKVRVKFKAENLRSALKTVRGSFGGAFIVR